MTVNPKIYRVILPVTDIEKAQKFYENLFELKGQRVSPGRHYFDCGGTILACFDSKADGDNLETTPNPDHIYFAVDQLDNLYEKAKKMDFTEVEDSIKTRPWGERSFYAKDPFGNPICFVERKTIFTGN
ncbi:VOC family protein [Echinicola jeungdonensis]|uniref:VOC family protein n=1 Tax=Echinicola jeungdonensis TaxID=709343 RepID=A0ABV5J3K9_9BACT|nr:VOC family protein [Echinicola jeungdonensis]MDN3668238.1 VOC family protein [Echinicola jeungdonensis]